MTRQQIFRHIENELKNTFPPDETSGLTWWILEELTGLNRTQLITSSQDINIPHLDDTLCRLKSGEPVQYIFHHTLWHGLDLQLSPATLIPRPETAELVDWLLQDHPKLDTENKALRIADIGTGSGCIAIALKSARPTWDITAVDISAAALSIAAENAQRNHVSIRFLEADITDISTWQNTTYDIIISNPPYIRESEKVSMKATVFDYEPQQALFVPDNDPLLFYRAIAQPQVAKEIYVEINEGLAQQTAQLFEKYGYKDVETRQDCYGKPRMVRGRLVR